MNLKCIKDCSSFFTKGKLYEVENRLPNGYRLFDNDGEFHTVTNDKNFVEEHFVIADADAEENLCYCSAEDGIVCGFCHDKMYKALEGKVVDARELLSAINGQAEGKSDDVKEFAERVMDLIFSHCK